jgi:ferric-dicitrate binding protein FerR (iron transport regulator)
MEKNFLHVEDIIADERFQAWYYGTDKAKGAGWESVMAANPSLAGLVAEARDIMDSLSLKEKEVSVDQHATAHQKLMQSIAENEATRPRVVSLKRRRLWYWAAAAVIVLTIGAAGFWANKASSEMVHTSFGEIREQSLPDGSKVTLNANSEITYSEGWDKGAEREVWLKGEAFFHVQKTPAKSRFVVHADQFDVIVTGTQFNVVNRDGKTNVMLTEGSVTIRTKDGKEIRMQPGDFVEINNQQPEKRNVPQENILAWRDKKLYFDNTPLRLAAKKIEEHYGVTVTLTDDSTGNRTISGMMPNDNLDVLLESLQSLEFRVARNKNEIIISNE